jgi:ribosomal protein L15
MWRKKCEVENHFGSGARGGGAGKGRGCGRGHGHGGSSSSGSSRKPTGDECRRCGKMGHWARECCSKSKKEQAHIAQDEEEASLMLAMATLIRPEVGHTEAGGPTVLAREVRQLGESSVETSA